MKGEGIRDHHAAFLAGRTDGTIDGEEVGAAEGEARRELDHTEGIGIGLETGDRFSVVEIEQPAVIIVDLDLGLPDFFPVIRDVDGEGGVVSRDEGFGFVAVPGEPVEQDLEEESHLCAVLSEETSIRRKNIADLVFAGSDGITRGQ